MVRFTFSSSKGPPTLKSTFWSVIRDMLLFYRVVTP
jgi:hypothetical protein